MDHQSPLTGQGGSDQRPRARTAMLTGIAGLGASVLLALSASGAQAAACSQQISSFNGTTVTQGGCGFGYSGAEQTFTVPAAVTKLTVSAVGAPGGADPSDQPADGGAASGTIAVTPGEVLDVEVGGPGASYGDGGAGGWNGGGPGQGETARAARRFRGERSRGSARDRRRHEASLASRLIVAGGDGRGGRWGYYGGGGGGGGGLDSPSLGQLGRRRWRRWWRRIVLRTGGGHHRTGHQRSGVDGHLVQLHHDDGAFDLDRRDRLSQPVL